MKNLRWRAAGSCKFDLAFKNAKLDLAFKNAKLDLAFKNAKLASEKLAKHKTS